MRHEMFFAIVRLTAFVFALQLYWPGVAFTAPAGQPATAPAPTTQAAPDAQIDDAIAKLGDPDPQVREQAARALWSRGRAAEAALKQAAAGPDPEVARRAASIL